MGTAGGQDGAMGFEMSAAHHYYTVTELALETLVIELLKCLFEMSRKIHGPASQAQGLGHTAASLCFTAPPGAAAAAFWPRPPPQPPATGRDERPGAGGRESRQRGGEAGGGREENTDTSAPDSATSSSRALTAGTSARKECRALIGPRLSRDFCCFSALVLCALPCGMHINKADRKARAVKVAASQRFYFTVKEVLPGVAIPPAAHAPPFTSSMGSLLRRM